MFESAPGLNPHATAEPGVSNGCLRCMDGRSRHCRPTVKPGDEAQTLVPWVLKMAALSRLPVPTKLPSSASVSERLGDGFMGEGTWYQHIL